MLESCLSSVPEPTNAHMAETFNEYFNSDGLNATKLQDFSHSINLRPLGEKEIASIIEKLDNKHFSGIDHISNAIVKISQVAIVPILTMLVHQSSQRGDFLLI